MMLRALFLAPVALLVLVEAACFNPTYDGDVSFSCDPKEPTADRCPGGFHCVPDDGRCHRTCSGPSDCSAGSDCVDRGGVKVCWTKQTPGPDGAVDGQVPDGPSAAGCYRWEHLGKLAVSSGVPFAVGVDQQGRPHVVHLDNEGHVVERFETGGSWQAKQITALANTSQVAAAVDSNNQLHFVYSSAKGPVQHCTKSATNDDVACAKESTLSVGPLGGAKSISGLDLSAAPTGGWLALAVTLEAQDGKPHLVYASVVPDPGANFVYSWRCNDDAVATDPRRGPRIAAGADFAVVSFYLDGPASQSWEVVHFPKSAGPDNGASCQGLPAATVPRSAAARLPLGVEQGQVHAARGFGPDVQHLVWPLATFQITAPSEVVFSGAFAAGSLDLAAAGGVPLISGVIGEGTAFAPPVVWFKGTSGWSALSLPAQLPAEGAGAGKLTRMAVDHTSGAIHVVHDGVDQDGDPALFYLRCRLP
jgi:hypothetical protein